MIKPDTDERSQVGGPPIENTLSPVKPLDRVSNSIRLPRALFSLRHRNFRLYWFGQIVSLSGTWMQTTAQSWLVYQLTLSPFTLGILSFANQIPTLLLTVFAGVILDRVNKRRYLIFTQTLAMIQAFLLAGLVLSGQVQAWQVIVLASILGIINAFDNPARHSIISELVPKSDVMNGIALYSTAFNGARIFGPALGGLVVAYFSAGGAFALNALSFVAVLAGLFMVRLEEPVKTKRSDSVLDSLKEGFRYIRRDRALSALIAHATLVGIFGIPYMTLMPVMARDVLGLGADGYGILMSATGLGAVVGALTLASLGNYRHKGWLVTAGNFAFPIMLALFSLSRWTPLSMLLLAGMAMFLIMRNATTNTLIQTNAPDQLRARVLSVYMMFFLGLSPLGALQSGWLAQQFDAPIALQINSAILLVAGVVVLWRRPEVHNLA